MAEDNNSEIIRYLTGGVLLRINRVTQKLDPELASFCRKTADFKQPIWRTQTHRSDPSVSVISMNQFGPLVKQSLSI